MAPLRLIWLLAAASCQRLESPDVDCEEGFVCKKDSVCPFYLERKEHLDFLKNTGGGAEYDDLLAALKKTVCNKANRGVCCRENFGEWEHSGKCRRDAFHCKVTVQNWIWKLVNMRC